MVSSVFVLFLLVFTQNGPAMDQIAYRTMDQCQAAKTKAIELAIKNNWNMGAIDCTEHKIGTFS